MITVHLGLHKTGSTSIQAALDLSRHRLSMAVLPPKVKEIWTSPSKIAAIASASRAGHVVVSDEGILGEMLDVYSNAGDRLDALRLALEGLDYNVVVYLRPQPSWLASVYLQSVQAGGTQTGAEFWTAVAGSELLSWSALCDLLRVKSGARQVRVRAHAPGRDVVADFFGVCGLGPAPRPTSDGIRVNESISAVQAPILGALNTVTLEPDDRLRFRHLFQGLLASGVDREWSPFPPDVQSQIADSSRADWLAVARSLDASDPSEAAVFRRAGDAWDGLPLPFTGTLSAEPVVLGELARSLTVLAKANPTAARGILGRAWSKAKERPSDVPRAVRASLRRGNRP